ncbi:hypothetical protein ACIBKY_08390 [Nonomuraea sp. NPDC050394]|uniref:hypothetical protein n=1 Tax=Nonomuraea sp. NPDC050394 TaxID=3364363 RepID=UPI0037B5D537
MSRLWWFVAFLVVASSLVRQWLPADDGQPVFCSWSGAEPRPLWEMVLPGYLLSAANATAVATALLLGWVSVRRSGLPRFATTTVVVLIALNHTLLEAARAISALPAGTACSIDPATFEATPWAEIAWTLAPALLVLFGVRAALDLPRLPWRPIALAAAVTAIAAFAVFLVRQPPAGPVASRTSDGTPRHVLAITGSTLTVVDLDDGGTTRVRAPDPAFYRFTAVARDVTPGAYLAAVTTQGDGAFGERTSRLHRVRMDGEGGATVGDQVGGDLEGWVMDLAVSGTGTIAYSRVLPDPEDSTEVASTVVGLIGQKREWSTRAPQHGPYGDGGLALHWRDAGTLAFRAVTAGGRSHIVALDISRPGDDLLAARKLHTFAALTDGSALSLPGGRVAMWTSDGDSYDETITVVDLPVKDPPHRRPAGVAFSPGCAVVMAYATDPSGRHLLVSVLNADEHGMEGMVRECAEHPGELYRVDLHASPPAGPADPALPRRRVWQGEEPFSAIVW